MATNAPLSHVSDTARWVAMYRALESERPDALFNDPYARRLAGAQGEAILDAIPKGRRMAWPMVVRTAVMDELILRTVTRDRADTVLNLAAGLDARAYRLPVPDSLRWFDVDLPDMIAYRDQHLSDARSACRHTSSAVDLTDGDARRALFREVAADSSQALVVSEGLLVYLGPDQVAELAEDLHAESAFRWWVIDLASPRLMKMLDKTWGDTLRAGNAPFRFAPAEGTGFFRAHGWEEAEFRSTWDESLRLRRTIPLAPLWTFLSRFYSKRKQEEIRRMSGTVLLRRAA